MVRRHFLALLAASPLAAAVLHETTVGSATSFVTINIDPGWLRPGMFLEVDGESFLITSVDDGKIGAVRGTLTRL